MIHRQVQRFVPSFLLFLVSGFIL
uniref:Uncharacterized protein n=1 Tax=Anguilla anguilla TaxID=7936 RepID=A0A0E9Q3F0_ANGAN